MQAGCGELGLQAPSSVIGNSDQQTVQMLALMQREGQEFYAMPNGNGGWEALRKEYTFNTVSSGLLTGDVTSGSAIVTGLSSTSSIAAAMVAVGNYIPVGTTVVSVDSSTQVTLSAAATGTATASSMYFGQDNYAFPADIAYFMSQTFWDRAFRWQLLGPLSAQEWQVLKSGISPTGPRRRFRIMGNRFYLDPVPNDNGSVEAFEYYSNGWAQSMSGTAQTKFLADTDYYILDDDCMILGLIWRFLRAKRLSYEEEYKTYKNACERVLARDGANRSLPLNSSASGIRLLNNQNVPDTGYGS